jgi:hypothetical protein
VPYLPSGMRTLESISYGELPFIARDDLVVYKIFCCGLRANERKKEQDVNDAYKLLKQRGRPMALNKAQREAVLSGMESTTPEGSGGWSSCSYKWKAMLGIQRSSIVAC